LGESNLKLVYAIVATSNVPVGFYQGVIAVYGTGEPNIDASV